MKKILKVIYEEGENIRSLTGVIDSKKDNWIKIKQPNGKYWTIINVKQIIKITNKIKEDINEEKTGKE